MGRLHLHRGLHQEALRFFQLGQIAAQDSGCELTVAMLCANEAWAYGSIDDEQQALKSIGRAQDEFARADPAAAQPWVRFFEEADLYALMGMARLERGVRRKAGLASAIDSLVRSLGLRGSDMARSRAFELTALATAQLLDGSSTEGMAAGHLAVDLAASLRSRRIADRLASLQAAAEQASNLADGRDLAARIVKLRAA